MAKYRLLSISELQELEKEFIEFLILNGIAAEDWAGMKKKEPDKAENIIHHFSDVVFEKIMRQTQFVERYSEKKVEVFQCLSDKFVIVCLDASKIKNANFTSKHYLETALKNPPAKLEVYTYDYTYNNAREEEIFNQIENGSHISNGKLFKTLCLFLPQ